MGFFKGNQDIQYEHRDILGYHVRMVTVGSEEAGKRLGRAIGEYYTIEVGTALHELLEIKNLCECLVSILDTALEPLYGKRLLVCGLGNPHDPADSLGPEITRFIPLRFLSEFFKEQCRFDQIFAFTPGVSMGNNLSTESMVKGIVDAAKADGVILIDSVVTHEYSHLFRIIEVSTAGGFTPHNGDTLVNWSALGVPVISIGIPTAIPGDFLFPGDAEKGSIFTESRVGDVITSARSIITYALIRVGWPKIPQNQCYAFSKISKDPTSLVGETFFTEGVK